METAELFHAADAVTGAQLHANQHAAGRAPAPAGRGVSEIRLSTPVFFEELELIWKAIQDDLLKPLFWSDFAPQTWEQWAEWMEMRTVDAWALHTPHGRLMGLAQVSARRETAGRLPLYGEMDIYLLPGYRGRLAAQAIRRVTTHLLDLGYQNLLAYIRRDHRQSRYMAAHLGWFRIGIVPAYIPWHGTLYDAVLYSLKPPQKDKSCRKD